MQRPIHKYIVGRCLGEKKAESPQQSSWKLSNRNRNKRGKTTTTIASKQRVKYQFIKRLPVKMYLRKSTEMTMPNNQKMDSMRKAPTDMAYGIYSCGWGVILWKFRLRPLLTPTCGKNTDKCGIQQAIGQKRARNVLNFGRIFRNKKRAVQETNP